MLPEKPRCRPLPIALPQNRGDGRRKINRLSGAQFPRAEVRFPGTFFVQADKSSCGSTPQHSLFLDALFGNASRLRDGSDVFLAVESALGWAPSQQSFVLQLNGLPVFGEASLEYGVDGFSLIRRALFCQVLPADISECHGRPECGASAGIAAAEMEAASLPMANKPGIGFLSTSKAGFSWPSRLFSGRPFGKGRKGPCDEYRFRSTRPTGYGLPFDPEG